MRHAAIISALMLLPAAATAAKGTKSGSRLPTVAVLYFDYDGPDAKMKVLKKGLAEMMIAELSQLSNIRVVERMRLEALLKEQKLSRSNRFDRRTALKLGRLLGAKYMIWGRYFQLGSFCLVGKVVEVETGKILPSAQSCGKKDDFLGAFRAVYDKLEQTVKTKLSAFTKRPVRRRASPARSAKAKKGKAVVASKRPLRLTTRVALRYARALDAKDRGDTKTARALLEKLVAEQPGFGAAKKLLAQLSRG